MWENRRASGAIEAEALDDIPRRSIQWQANEDSEISWEEISGHGREGNL